MLGGVKSIVTGQTAAGAITAPLWQELAESIAKPWPLIDSALKVSGAFPVLEMGAIVDVVTPSGVDTLALSTERTNSCTDCVCEFPTRTSAWGSSASDTGPRPSPVVNG